MNKQYTSPRALEQALNSQARIDSARLGVPTQELVGRFYFQRLLARVFQSEGWILKGGQALLVRYPAQARYSRDIDLFRPAQGNLDEAVAALDRAARLDLDDFLTYNQRSRSTNAADAATFKFDVALGTRHKDSISVDLVVKSTPTAAPNRVRLEPAVGLAWPDNWPEVTLYPIADHIADKICAMYERHEQTGGASSRFRDLADLLLISQQETVNGQSVRTALDSEIRRRTSLGTDLRVPQEFEVPDPVSWKSRYPAAAALVNGLRGCRTLDEATTAAHAFLTPLLGSTTSPGTWDPSVSAWLAMPSPRQAHR